EAGAILGAQVIVGDMDQVAFESSYGVRSVSDSTAVDSETQFCIGSCSKPFTSALLMTLVQDETLVLDKSIDAWLPEFESLKTSSGDNARAPTLRELLSHRGGIYSQKVGMTKRQTMWIRDFKLTLEDAVEGIAGEPLLADPGETYAYSGAGYCVIGRVAEVATKQSFESLLQEKISAPLQLSRTTYFPDPNDPNIATGSLRGKLNQSTPHLSMPFQLSLVGGSVYSTAKDSARFLQMVVNRGATEDGRLLSADIFDEYTRRQVEGQGYGLGWSLQIKNRKTVELTHSGSLASSRALFMVNLETGVYGAILYTVGNPQASKNLGRSVSQSLADVVRGAAN
ncbi:MAG: serine hydrolase, partial [Verrucomicrobia bacterium]|nr:serine hydrolase [Verrucomicrobiota bacterium]